MTNFNYIGIPLWEVNRRLDIALAWCPKGLHFHCSLVYSQIRQENISNIVKQTHLRNAINWRGRVSRAFLTQDAGRMGNSVCALCDEGRSDEVGQIQHGPMS